MANNHVLTQEEMEYRAAWLAAITANQVSIAGDAIDWRDGWRRGHGIFAMTATVETTGEIPMRISGDSPRLSMISGSNEFAQAFWNLPGSAFWGGRVLENVSFCVVSPYTDRQLGRLIAIQLWWVRVHFSLIVDDRKYIVGYQQVGGPKIIIDF